MRYFVDTNILARYYEGEKEAKDFLNKVVNGKLEVLIPAIVMEEMVWLMSRFYKSPKEEITNFQKAILGMSNVEIKYEYNLSEAINLYEKYNVKFNDCVIYSCMKNDDKIYSYDKDFDRLPGTRRVEPKDLLGK